MILRTWLLALTNRERVMLMIAASLAAGVLIWLAAGQLNEFKSAAKRDYDQSITDMNISRSILSPVKSEVDVLELIYEIGQIHDLIIEVSNVEGDVSISIASTTSEALFRFLRDIDKSRDLSVVNLAIVKNPDATVQMQAQIST